MVWEKRPPKERYRVLRRVRFESSNYWFGEQCVVLPQGTEILEYADSEEGLHYHCSEPAAFFTTYDLMRLSGFLERIC